MKYAVEQKSSAELLGLRRNVARKIPETEIERCVPEGLDVLGRLSPRYGRVPVRKVKTFV